MSYFKINDKCIETTKQHISLKQVSELIKANQLKFSSEPIYSAECIEDFLLGIANTRVIVTEDEEGNFEILSNKMFVFSLLEFVVNKNRGISKVPTINELNNSNFDKLENILQRKLQKVMFTFLIISLENTSQNVIEEIKKKISSYGAYYA